MLSIRRLGLRRGMSTLKIFDQNGQILEKPDPQINHFKVFELDPSFDVDARNLTKNFRSLQAKLHPDKFATKGKDQTDLAEEWSARVNQAYQV